MTYESIKYILSKQIEKKEKKDEIEELGINFGEKATNHLMNNNVNEGNNNSKKITDYILIFIKRKRFWRKIKGYESKNVRFYKRSQ